MQPKRGDPSKIPERLGVGAMLASAPELVVLARTFTRENMSQSHQEVQEQDLSVLNGVPVLVVEDAWHVARAMKSALGQLGMNWVVPVGDCDYPTRSKESQSGTLLRTAG